MKDEKNDCKSLDKNNNCDDKKSIITRILSVVVESWGAYGNESVYGRAANDAKSILEKK